jgi:hypothetical protein
MLAVVFFGPVMNIHEAEIKGWLRHTLLAFLLHLPAIYLGLKFRRQGAGIPSLC